MSGVKSYRERKPTKIVHAIRLPDLRGIGNSLPKGYALRYVLTTEYGASDDEHMIASGGDYIVIDESYAFVQTMSEFADRYEPNAGSEPPAMAAEPA